ncbi:cobalamin-binding protein [Aurantivibrio infirmus]
MINSVLIKTIPLIAFLVTLLASVGAVSESDEVLNKIFVIDYVGNEIHLDKPAQRIIALSPHIVENVFSAGAGDKLFGTIDYNLYPPEANSIRKVGGFDTLSLETIVALDPDLVIAWGSGNGSQTIAQLQSLGLPVYVDEPITMADISKSIRDIGILAGTETVSENVAEQFEAQLTQLRLNSENKNVVSVFYEVWHEPLQTLNKNHIISSVINVCQGENLFADAIPLAPKISKESVIARNPDVIVASGVDEKEPPWLSDWRQWASISAVKNASVFYIPPDLIQRHTTRILLGTAMMCEHLDKARDAKK